MVKQEIRVVHALDYFLIGVCLICVLALAAIDVARSANAEEMVAPERCFGNCTEFAEAQITQDPVLVLQRLNNHNQAYYAAQIAARRPIYTTGHIPVFLGVGPYGLSNAAGVRGEYDLELQRRSLCAGFASNRGAGPEGVYAGRALNCRGSVFD